MNQDYHTSTIKFVTSSQHIISFSFFLSFYSHFTFVMSINHFSPDLPETLWWAQQQRHHHHHNMQPSSKPNILAAAPTTFWANSQLYHPIEANNPHNSALNFDLNNEDEDETTTIEDERENSERIIKRVEETEIPKEPLFEKPLTPSDVGKLNRLVIPKQHAEKYFPLGGSDSGGEKGLLLSFEDESGKPWRFRYSYWNSSQSYVLTKGWSRFVKEKRLDAGDIVLFERHRLDGDRLFIGWRRRRSSAAAAAAPQENEGGVVAQGQPATVGGGRTQVYFPAGHHAYPPPQHHHQGPAFPYQPECLHAAAAALQNQTTATSANSKTLRLFGVNLEFEQQPSEYSESSSETPNPPDGSSTWSQGQGQGHYQFQYDPKVHHAYFNHHNHMDINFSRDMNQTRYRRG